MNQLFDGKLSNIADFLRTCALEGSKRMPEEGQAVPSMYEKFIEECVRQTGDANFKMSKSEFKDFFNLEEIRGIRRKGTARSPRQFGSFMAQGTVVPKRTRTRKNAGTDATPETPTGNERPAETQPATQPDGEW